MPGIPHSNEHLRATRSDGCKRRSLVYDCRYCDHTTRVLIPDSPTFRVYQYRVCARCAAESWAARTGTRVMSEDELDIALMRAARAESWERIPFEQVVRSLGLH